MDYSRVWVDLGIYGIPPTLSLDRPRTKLKSVHHFLRKAQPGLNSIPAQLRLRADGVKLAFKGHHLFSNLHQVWGISQLTSLLSGWT